MSHLCHPYHLQQRSDIEQNLSTDYRKKTKDRGKHGFFLKPTSISFLELPQTGWHKMRETYSLTVWNPEVQKQGVIRTTLSGGSTGKSIPCFF